MWILTSNAFVSIVEHLDDPGALIVRGRFAGDAARFLGVPLAREKETPDADYRFRIVAKRESVERSVVRAVRGVRYPNFKDSILEAWRKALALRVWSIFHAAQQERGGR
jgi:hypothetical protein